jgi:hypothetical protein
MIALPVPPGDPATPLPWVLLQTARGNFIVGNRGRIPAVIARITVPADAQRIFQAVHAYQPMLDVMRMVKTRLQAEPKINGSVLSAHFTYEESLIILNALAVVEGQASRG